MVLHGKDTFQKLKKYNVFVQKCRNKTLSKTYSAERWLADFLGFEEVWQHFMKIKPSFFES